MTANGHPSQDPLPRTQGGWLGLGVDAQAPVGAGARAGPPRDAGSDAPALAANTQVFSADASTPVPDALAAAVHA